MAAISSVYAAGLGKLTVLSGLGQPLNAEIELTSVQREEANSLTVRLAPVEEFRRANIEFHPNLYNLRFAVEQRGSRQVVRISSTQPMNEPFVDLLLEVAGTGSRLVREYTFLLDPPELRRTQPALAATTPVPAATPTPVPAPSVTAAPAPAATRPAPVRPATPAVAATRPAAASAASSDTYRVRAGDSLHGIARRHRPGNVSLDQMLVAMQRANPSAFVDNNMNRLRAGEILKIPSATAAAQLNAAQARQIVVAQAADFNEYRARLAGQAGAARSAPAATGQSAAGTVTATVEERPGAPSQSRDRLQVSRAGIGSPVEEGIAQQKALAEATAQIAEMEKNLKNMQRLLELRSQELAQLQASMNMPAAAAAGVAASQSGEAAAAQVAQADSAKLSPETTAQTAAEAAPATTTAEAAPTSATTPEAAQPAPESAPVAVQETQANPPPAEASTVTPAAPAPENAPGFWANLTSNPWVTLLIALLLALAGALGLRGYFQRRRNQGLDDTEPLEEPSSLRTNSLFGATGGQTVDTSNSGFNSSFSPSASQLDTNEVDPVAEADVYIAYGRDAQAEEILKEALRTQPERDAVRLKLLEIYAARKDVQAFSALAEELRERTRSEGEDWVQAATLGLTIDPGNPLYASGRVRTGEPRTPMAQPAEVDDELDLNALLNASTVGAAFGAAAAAAAPEQTDAQDAAPAADALSDDALAAGEFAAAAEPAQDGNSLEFDIDFSVLDDKPDAKAGAEGAPSQADGDAGLDFHASSSADLPADAVPPVAKASQDEDIKPLDFDLSGIDLELTQPDGAESAGIGAGNGSAPENPANFAEMATKLDLALAYREIGDQEGARVLLDEVVKGGSPEQSEKAKSLLQGLA